MRTLEGFLFAAEDARRLAALRIGLCGLLAWRLAIGDYSFVAGQPEALFQPVSFMKLFGEMPGHDLTVALQILGVAAALLAAAGLWTRASLPIAFVCALVLNGMLNATGKIVHNDVLLLLCLVPLVASPRAASAAWSLRLPWRAARRDRPPQSGEAYGWPVRTAMVVVALAYFFVGFQKLRFSGIDWITSDNLRWVLYASSDSQSEPNQLALFIADRAWMTHLLAAGTVFLELFFPLALFWPRLRWLFVPGVVSLHLGIWLMMGLDYSAQALTVIIVFVNWPWVADWVRRRLPAYRDRSSPASATTR
jgi:hypothetical protein